MTSLFVRSVRVRSAASRTALVLTWSLAACSGAGSNVAADSHASTALIPAAAGAAAPALAQTAAVAGTQTIRLGPALSVALAPISSGASAGIDFPETATGTGLATISLSAAPPPGVPALHRLSAPVTPLAYVTLEPSTDVSFRATPGATFTFPAGTLAGYAYLAFFDPANPSLGWNVMSGPARASGTRVSLPSQPDASPPLALAAKNAYVFAVAQSAGVLPTPAPAPGTITEYEIPNGANAGLSNGIVAGPDGNVWFTEFSTSSIDKITPDGVLTRYPLPAKNLGPQGIAAGPDGNLWFAEFRTGAIGKITPSGAVTEYPLPHPAAGPLNIAAGPDGNLWFTEYRRPGIGKITTAGVITEYPLPKSGTQTFEPGLFDIAAGPDGNVWFTEFNRISNGGNNIGKITPRGTITLYPLVEDETGPIGITGGTDGNVWFVENGAGRVAKITPNGTITVESRLLGYELQEITLGPDDNFWLTSPPGTVIRFTQSDRPTKFFSPIPNTSPLGIVTGPDGNIWFTESAGYVGKLRVK